MNPGRRQIAGVSHMVGLTAAITALPSLRLSASSRWGRHIYAFGGNEQPPRLACVAVNASRLQPYTLFGADLGHPPPSCGRLAGLGVNALGRAMSSGSSPLRPIGVANLLGGEVGASPP